MHIGFKTFQPIRTVFFVCLLQIVAFSYASAADEIFNVRGVKVDITAKSAVEAREIAFERAQKQAFATLAERMLGQGDAAQYADQDIDTIASMIQDFEIKNEQLSSVRYVATYDFRFRDSAVRDFFGGAGVQYTDRTNKTSLVLPYYQKGTTTYLWSPYNEWMKAWLQGDHQNGLVPLVVPMGDLMDVSDVREEDGLNYEVSRLNNMLGRYDANEAIMLMAVPDERLSAVQGMDDAAVGEMKIHIYRTDRGRAEYVQPISLQARETDTLRSFLAFAVERVKNELQRNWKEQTVANPTRHANAITVSVPIESLQEWSAIQRSLRKVYGIDRFNLKSLKPNLAVIEVVYDGDFERLRSGLANVNLMIEEESIAAPSSDPMSYYAQSQASMNQSYILRQRHKGTSSREMIFVPGHR